MGAEINLLDWLFTGGQGLFAASFLYFLYLVIWFSRITPIICGGFQGWPEALIRGSEVTSSRYFSME